MYSNNNPFYVSPEWRKLRKEILKKDKYECQVCKSKGKYTKANTVHHVKHLEDYPELGIEEYYQENGKQYRNLISVCKDCHENVCHPERLRWNKKEPLTEERW